MLNVFEILAMLFKLQICKNEIQIKLPEFRIHVTFFQDNAFEKLEIH